MAGFLLAVGANPRMMVETHGVRNGGGTTYLPSLFLGLLARLLACLLVNLNDFLLVVGTKYRSPAHLFGVAFFSFVGCGSHGCYHDFCSYCHYDYWCCDDGCVDVSLFVGCCCITPRYLSSQEKEEKTEDGVRVMEKNPSENWNSRKMVRTNEPFAESM